MNNRVFVPSFVCELKDRYDDMVKQLLVEGKVNGYSCTPEYKGRSFISSKIQISASYNGKEVFKEKIEIW